MGPSTVQILMLIVLIMLSCFFSASETALMSLSKIRIKHMVEEGIKGASTIEKLLENPNKLLSSILVGNNLVNIGASALATSIAIDIWGNEGVALATGIMTILVLIFGEITPKTLAVQNSEKISLKIAKTISFVVILFKPIVVVCNFISSPFIKLFGGKTHGTQPYITQEELKTMVDVSEEEGVLEGQEKEMIFNVFEFGDLQVKDVMVQRVDITALDVNSTYDEVMETIKRDQFSRIPIYKETIDEIIGILNLKDLVLLDNKDGFLVESLMREPYYTYEFKKIMDLFREMQKERAYMAIVLDEYGGTVGIVTMEDLVEEIVGEIEDEYDDEEEKEIEVIKEDEYVVVGSIRIDDLNDLIGTSMESEEFDSIGGFIIGEIGRFPEVGEEIQYQNIKFVIEQVDKNRIMKIRIFT